MKTIYETALTTIRVSEDSTITTIDCVSLGGFFVSYLADGKSNGPSTSVLMIILA